VKRGQSPSRGRDSRMDARRRHAKIAGRLLGKPERPEGKPERSWGEGKLWNATTESRRRGGVKVSSEVVQLPQERRRW